MAQGPTSLVISVAYESSRQAFAPAPRRLIAPLSISIDTHTRLVLEVKGVSCRGEPPVEVDIEKHTTSFSKAIVDGPIWPHVFKLVPPR
jgi:hypothetical protein